MNRSFWAPSLSKASETGRLRLREFVLAVCVGLLVLAGIWTVRRPAVILLRSDHGASWIRVDRPFDLVLHSDTASCAFFRCDFDVNGPSRGAELHVIGLRRVELSVDHRPVFDSGPESTPWNRVRTVSLPVLLSGRHSLQIKVTNPNGPALVRLDCDALDVHTNRTWAASEDGRQWRPARCATDPWVPSIAEQFPTAVQSLRHDGAFLLLIAGIGAAAAWRLGTNGVDRRSSTVWASRLRWVVLSAWVVLAVHNLPVVPSYLGYDARYHLLYITQIVEQHRLPLSTEGWQDFQTPLYYVLSAVLDATLQAARVSPELIPTLLRVLPLACGLVMVQLCYQAGRAAFPGRSDLHAVSTVVGGLLPMNLYMMQYLSNEPLAACLGSVLVVLCLGLIGRPFLPTSDRRMVVIGLVWGLAVLSKVSALVWALPLAFAFAVAMRRTSSTPREAAKRGGLLLGTAALTSGWYFVRNWLAIGTAFLSHSSQGQPDWWQDPGFRTPTDFLAFGQGLTRPVYSGVGRLWDSLYGTLWGDSFLSAMTQFEFRPPWRYGLMGCGLWLALVPTLCIGIGASRCWGRQATVKNRPSADLATFHRATIAFAALSVASFVGAIAFVYLTLPIFSDAKASYAGGCTPCLAVLAAAGFDRLTTRRWARVVVVGLITCWAVTAYLTFFAKT